MATITIKVDERTKAGKTFMALADTFLKNQEGIEVIKNKPDNSRKRSTRKEILELSKKINKGITRRTFEKLGLDYDSYSGQ